MVSFKIVINDPKTGKSYQKEAKEDAAAKLIGKKIGDKIRGEIFDLTGYEFTITGGSDYCGFPMRKDVPGIGRKRILAVTGIGFRKGKKWNKGMKQRKTVCGNTIYDKTAQINLKIEAYGKEPLAGVEEKPKEEPKKEVKKAEEKKAEAKKEVKKQEKPKEEKKPEVKKETPKSEEKKEENK